MIIGQVFNPFIQSPTDASTMQVLLQILILKCHALRRFRLEYC